MKDYNINNFSVIRILKIKFILMALLSFAIFGMVESACAADWYVSKNCASFCNGQTWAKGWNDFDSVVWGNGGVVAGDTLWIDGGTSGYTYTKPLYVGADGTSDSVRIHIKPGAAHPSPAGHDGLVTITTSDTSCTSGICRVGAWITRNYINIDGMVSGSRTIRITDCAGGGMYLGNGAYGIKVNGLHVDHNPLADTGNSAGNVGIRAQGSSGGPAGVMRVEISNCETDHNWEYQIMIQPAPDEMGYGYYLIHHNYVHDHPGEDMIYAAGSSDVYHNELTGLLPRNSTGFHPDGLVAMGSYIRFYNNYIHDFVQPDGNGTGSYIYLNPFTIIPNTQVCCWRVYNNLLVQTIVSPQGNYNRGIEFSTQTGESGSYSAIHDIVIANNTIVGMPQSCMNIFPKSLDIHDIYIVNNLCHNDAASEDNVAPFIFGNMDITPYTIGSWGTDKNVTFDYNIISAGKTGDNYIGTSEIGNPGWPGYTPAEFTARNANPIFTPNVHMINQPDDPGLTSTYELPEGTSNAKDSGLPLTAYFSKDKNGVSRPQGSAWDIGAYEYVPGEDTTPPSAPVGLTIK